MGETGEKTPLKPCRAWFFRLFTLSESVTQSQTKQVDCIGFHLFLLVPENVGGKRLYIFNGKGDAVEESMLFPC